MVKNKSTPTKLAGKIPVASAKKMEFFRLAPSINKKVSPIKAAAYGDDQFSEIKVAVIRGGPECSAYAYYIVREAGITQSSAADRCMFQAAIQEHADWVTMIGVCTTERLRLFQNGVVVLNNRGYPIRVWVIFTSDPPTQVDLIYRLGMQICDCINERPDLEENQQVRIHVSSFLVSADACWSEILGDGQALALACRLMDVRNNDYSSLLANGNRELWTFWNRNAVPMSIARRMGLPTELAVREEAAEVANGNGQD
jgi:hypothetical protein